MQTSVSFILESTMSNFDVDAYLANSKGYNRNRLPQIDPDTFDRVLLHLARVHEVKHFKVKPGKLKPCQNEINIDKVQNMIKEGRDFSNAKFICSKDWEIVDGHHTHVGAIHTLSEEDRVDAYRTNLPINKLVEVLNKLKVTTRQLINESAMPYLSDLDAVYNYKDSRNDNSVLSLVNHKGSPYDGGVVYAYGSIKGTLALEDRKIDVYYHPVNGKYSMVRYVSTDNINGGRKQWSIDSSVHKVEMSSVLKEHIAKNKLALSNDNVVLVCLNPDWHIKAKFVTVDNTLDESTVNESASDISDWSEGNVNDLAFEVGYKGNAIGKTWYTDGGDIDWTAVIHDKPWPMYDGTKDNTKAFVMSSDGHAIASTNVKNTSDANLKSIIDNFVKTSKLSVLYDAGFTDAD